MTAVIVPGRVPQLIQPHQFARWNLIPQARWAAKLADVANYLLLNQRKQVFSSTGALTNIPAAGGTGARSRWAFRCHTGYGARRFVIAGRMAQTPTFGTAAAYSKLTLTPVGGGSTVVSPDIVYGNVDASATVDDSFDEHFDFTVVTPLVTENKTYEGLFEDYQNARIIQATVWEESLAPRTENGFLERDFSLGQNIYDSQRDDVFSMLTDLWCRNAAPLIAYSTPTGATPPGIASTTQTNVVDRTSTTVTADTPGFYCALQYCRTLGFATVPCIFSVRAFTTTGSGGSVYLKDSSGTLATISGIGTTPQWYTVAVNLPATNTKKDIHFSTTTGTLRLHAASLYQYL